MKKHLIHGAKILLIALFMLGSLQLEAMAPAARAVTQAEIDALKEDAEGYSSEKDQLQAQIDALANDKENALAKKTLLDQQSDALASEISTIESIIADYNTLIAQTEAELADAQEREAVQYERFCKRVRAMEENGTVSYWSVLFKAEDFTDLLSRLSDIQEIMDYDQGVIDALKKTQAEIAAKEKLLQEYNARKDSITNSITQAVEKAKQIEYAAKVRYALEGERLAVFASKWVRYCESMTDAVDKALLTKAKEYVKNAQKEIEEGLSRDLDLGVYLGEAAEIYDAERGRLAKIMSKTDGAPS